MAALVLGACSTEQADRIELGNGAGKDDSVTLRLKLTDSNPVVSFTVGCDQPSGCEGHVGVALKTPAPCALFPEEQRCGVARTAQPLSREVLAASITSSTEGERKLPLLVQSGDGMTFTTDIAAAFTAKTSEEIEITIEKVSGTPDMTIEVGAEWAATNDPGAAVAELTAFLGTVPGMTYSEIGTQYAGYRAFMLEYEQPLDHTNPGAGTFKQRAVLHHRDKAAPFVLYTSGYSLFENDYLSELGESLQGNQLSTEQRWFGTSRPANVTPESWQLVTIEQAATDHHRFVEALRPFYSGKWLNTGHSKGGMTSVFHRRFFPDDVDATVAYVAPISYADPDPRYVSFLDQIGEEACRTAIRNVQKRALEQFDQLLPMAQAEMAGHTFERTGGIASSFEKSIIQLEWSYWQYMTAAQCTQFLDAPTDTAGLYNLVASYAGVGIPDYAFEDSLAYYYQSTTELGKQAFATAHLAGLLKHEATRINWAPTGTNPVHSRAAMDDIQAWVTSNASQMLFLYGETDPWTGGAYEVGTQSDVIKVVAPDAPHAAMLTSLTATDRERALRAIELWVGKRPAITPAQPRGPATPRMF